MSWRQMRNAMLNADQIFVRLESHVIAPDPQALPTHIWPTTAFMKLVYRYYETDLGWSPEERIRYIHTQDELEDVIGLMQSWVKCDEHNEISLSVEIRGTGLTITGKFK